MAQSIVGCSLRRACYRVQFWGVAAMTSLRAIRELRVCGEVTTEYLKQPITIFEDAVLDSILLRALVWANPADAVACSAVCKRWRLLTGTSAG